MVTAFFASWIVTRYSGPYTFPLSSLCVWVTAVLILGTLSKDVFERRTSTGSAAFSLFICLDANKLVLMSFFSLLKTIYARVSTKPLPNDAKSPLPVDVRRSKTLLLKLPIRKGKRGAWKGRVVLVNTPTKAGLSCRREGCPAVCALWSKDIFGVWWTVEV